MAPPDFPRREPTPSIAALPFSLHSLLKGMKAISFVASKRVYLEALARQFCSDPKKTQRASGVVPKRVAKEAKLESLKKKNAASVSCHAAIKINTPLDETKMRWLVGELMKTDVPTVCPHGRPIILRYDLREIQKAFKRA